MLISKECMFALIVIHINSSKHTCAVISRASLQHKTDRLSCQLTAHHDSIVPIHQTQAVIIPGYLPEYRLFKC